MTDRDDIEQLFRAHYAQMYRLAAMLLHDEDLARDIVHDVFLTLLDKGSGLQASAGYLLRAVRNRCLNHIRDCNIHQRIANRYFLEDREYDAEQWPDEEALARIHSIIEKDLTEQARRVMQLRFTDGLPFAQVAQRMGISEAAVYRHLHHALTLIRKKLNENG